MGNKNKARNRTRQQKKHYSVTTSTKPLDAELELSGEQIMLISQFLHEVQEIKAQQPNAAMPDMSRVALSIAQNPQLASVLDAIRAREDAKQAAMEYGFDTKAAPAGSFPQMAAAAKWGGAKDDDPIGVTNYTVLRKWADENVWVRAAIDIRRAQIEGMKPVCIPDNPKKRYDRKVQSLIQNILNRPNERRDSWRTTIGPVLEDILVLDRGALLKNMTLDRKPVALYFADGATIKIYPGWDGNPKTPRYLYVSPDGKEKTPLRNDECIMMVSKSASHRVSLSPVQALQNTIIADIEATATAARLGKMKPPPHAIQIPKATPKQIADIANDYDARIAGRKELLWFGGAEAAHLFPLVYSAKDNQLLEWQVYLGRKIAVLFQISPQKLGITMDVNRANGEVQQEIDEDRGLIPLLLLIEEYLNMEILGDFAPLDVFGLPDLEALNLKVIFPEVSDAARKLHAKETIEMASKANPGLPSMTINMILTMLGEDIVKGGDTFYSSSMGKPIKWLSYDEPLDSMPQNAPTTSPDEAEPGEPTEDSTTEAESKKPPDGNDKGKDGTTGKMYSGYHDTRSYGKSWSPSVNAATKTVSLRETQKSGKSKKIPEKFLNRQKAPDLTAAEAVLSNAVQKLFDEASERGNRALQRLEHAL